ncbi:C2 [Sweet potato golden vein Korea virus]|uniref:Transcriptional activator protein n=1 Tax=Sweet potato golden vein Korea virus TaxID=2169736 RepID=A0A159YQV9_9GEMI|nr:C2 [Sweet potato golden vein Korea virus]AMY63154.1 C2 [Sweet potato golden vein Korea virus]
MSTTPSGFKRKCPEQEPAHAAAKKKRKAPEPRTRLVWKGCGCSAFITNECKYQNGFTHRGVTKSCTDYESYRVQQFFREQDKPPVSPQIFIRPPERIEENNPEVPTSGELQGKEAAGLSQDIPAVSDNFNPSDWCYSQLDWYFNSP